MVGVPYDCLANPLGAVRHLFANNFHPQSTGRRDDWGVKDLFESFVRDETNRLNIPDINSSALNARGSNSLVKFRGMVQDMLDAEFYVGAFKKNDRWFTAKYGDTSECEFENDCEHQIWDRKSYYVVPIPGENVWVKKNNSNCHADSTFKPSSGSNSNLCANSNASVPQGEKRSRADEEDCAMEDALPCMNSEYEYEENAKKQRVDDPSAGIYSEHDSNNLDPFLFPSPSPLSCVVKVYDHEDDVHGQLSLNDVVEFYGIVYFEHGQQQDDLFFPSYHHSSNIPQFHCLYFKKEPNCFPVFSLASEIVARNEILLNLQEIRLTLLNFFKKLFFGDEIAAEFFLLHLLSRVHSRVDPISLGHFSLNLLTSAFRQNKSGSGNQDEKLDERLINCIKKCLKLLMPCSVSLDLSLTTLNSSSLIPKKDYDQNRLLPGSLQLPFGAHLTIDETGLQSGTLNSVGVKNVSALKTLAESQTVEYDFEYYNMHLVADVAILNFSEAKSNLIPSDFILPINMCSNGADVAYDSPTLGLEESQLSKWRMYINLARHMENVIPENIQKVLENDMVFARQQDRMVSSQTFHKWLTMARLTAVSFGESELNLERWKQVRDLDHKVEARRRLL